MTGAYNDEGYYVAVVDGVTIIFVSYEEYLDYVKI